KGGGGSHAAIAARPGSGVAATAAVGAGERRALSRGRIHAADPVIAGVGYIHIAGRVHCYAVGRAERRRGAWAVVALVARLAGSGHGSDGARRSYLADPILDAVGDKQVARGIYRYAPGLDPRLRGWSAVADGGRGSGERGHGAAHRKTANAVVIQVGHV